MGYICMGSHPHPHRVHDPETRVAPEAIYMAPSHRAHRRNERLTLEHCNSSNVSFMQNTC